MRFLSKRRLSAAAGVLAFLLAVLLVFTNVFLALADTADINVKTEFQFLRDRLPAVPAAEYEAFQSGDFFAWSVPWNPSIPPVSPAGAPIIAEYNKEVLPDETVTFAGWDFTSFSEEKKGSDTCFWIWSGKGGGTLMKMELQSVDKDVVMATVPKDMPPDMYLVWAENSKGVSTPVFINRAIPQWIGPLGDSAAPGETKRLFGRNLTDTLKDRRDDGKALSYVYLRPKAGGTVTKCALKTDMSRTENELNPYNVSFTLPETLTPGEYLVYVTNGLGGAYGFDRPLPLTVEPKFAYGAYTETLSPSGENDSNRINDALKRISLQPGGGTLVLTEGAFYSDYELNIIKNTRVAGAGMDKTVLEVDNWINLGREQADSAADYNNYAIENLTIKTREDATAETIYLRTSSNTYGGAFSRNILFDGVRFLSGGYGSYSQVVLMAERVEIKNCNFEWKLVSTPTDWWIHDNVFNGVKTVDQRESDGSMSFSANRQNDGKSGKLIVEHNFAQTPDWPVAPDGNVNYNEFETKEDFGNRQHNTRLMHFAAHSENLQYSYIAYNETKDTGIIDNKGEQILYHSQECGAYFRTASSTADTVSINTTPDPTFLIQDLSGSKYDGPMTSVPDAIIYMDTAGGTIDKSALLIIVDGKGKGQSRKVLSHTNTTLTVDEPFRVVPDSTSVIQLTCAYMDQVVYKNELNGLPEGYKDTSHVASTGVDFDGGCFNCVADGNVNRRTFYGDMIQAYTTSVAMWNVLRNGKSIDSYRTGAVISAINGSSASSSSAIPGTLAAAGTMAMGSWIRSYTTDCGILVTPETKGMTTGSTVDKVIDGCGVENTTIDKTFYSLSPSVGKTLLNFHGSTMENKQGALAVEGFTSAVVRNIVLGKNLAAPKIVSAYDSMPVYSNITAENGGTVEYAGTKGDETPLVPFRSLHFVSAPGVNPARQTLAVSNFGEIYADWYIDRVEGSFIKTAVSGNIFTPRSPAGSLTVGIDAKSLGAGGYTGVVYLKSHAGASVAVGVRYDCAAKYAGAAADDGAPYTDTISPYDPSGGSSAPGATTAPVKPGGTTAVPTTVTTKKPAKPAQPTAGEDTEEPADTQSGKKVVVFGTLADENDSLLANTTVSVEEAGLQTVTDADGQFEFYNLEQGTYTLRAADRAGTELGSFQVNLGFSSESRLEGSSILVRETDSAVLVRLKRGADNRLTVSEVQGVDTAVEKVAEQVKTITTTIRVFNVLNFVIIVAACVLAATLGLLCWMLVRRMSNRRRGRNG